MLSERELKTLCEVYQIMNCIRARDGAPIGWCEEYFDKLTQRVDDLVMKLTGTQAWLNPLLHKDIKD